MGKASRDKGKRGEREARDQVRELWKSPDCIRAAQSNGKYSADLLGGPPGLSLEVKRYKRIPASDWVARTAEDAHGDDVGVTLAREDNGDWIVMIRMEDTEKFARDLIRHIGVDGREEGLS